MNAKETKEQKKLSVTKNTPEERIDQFLAKKIPDFSRSRLQKLIKGKQVLIKNKSITNASYKIKPGDFIVVNIPKASEGKLKASKIALEILYEDQDIIVINKPAGLVVHPGAGNWENTLVNALLAHCGNNLSGIGGVRRPGIVHRLDKETSGALVVAKNDYTHINLSKQFSDRKIMRSYQAIVWGWLGKNQGTFKGNLGRNPKNRKKMTVLRSGGKHAVTHYKMVKRIGNTQTEGASFIECRLETGRTHQIRVHLSHNGFPIIGDKIYGKQRKISDLTLNRHMLHANKLGFVHPRKNKFLTYRTKTPAIFNSLIDKLSSGFSDKY